MARTKSSRGVAPFKLRSGGSPLQFFGGIKKFGKKLMGATPIGMAVNALKGNKGGGDDAAGAMSGDAAMGSSMADQAQSAAMGGEGSDQKLEAINEILNS